MGEEAVSSNIDAGLKALTDEVRALRTEQRELARAVDQLTQTFRSLAVHLGIVAEPYTGNKSSGRPKDLPGFA
jgi:hypothetical protein